MLRCFCEIGCLVKYPEGGFFMNKKWLSLLLCVAVVLAVVLWQVSVPASAEKEVRNPDLDYITPKEN